MSIFTATVGTKEAVAAAVAAAATFVITQKATEVGVAYASQKFAERKAAKLKAA